MPTIKPTPPITAPIMAPTDKFLLLLSLLLLLLSDGSVVGGRALAVQVISQVIFFFWDTPV